ncbi:MAG: NADH-quinone oxidoreductase subunit N [Candidatus Rokuibacteriota bacterium]|nr:MAG: NADH-quinone oxidoreductase subunit N [Candidatus Rokubacteria bacterium]
MLLTLELALAGLILVVLGVGLLAGPDRERKVGVVAAAGLLGLVVLSLVFDGRGVLFDGTFVVDGLAMLFKRLFLGATLLGVVGGLALPGPAVRRRALEYHFLVLVSLLGMLVLASARELVLLFVAFELMSIPLYVLAGFAKSDARAVEAALKFFLVGSLSTAIFAYGLSFVYGATGTTRLPEIARAGAGHPLLVLGLLLVLSGIGFKIAAFPFHMWVPDTYEAATTPFVAWLSVAPKAAGFAAIFRIFVEGASGGGAAWVTLAAFLGGVTVVAGNLLALPQTDAKRLLAYSGVAHIGYMLVGVAAMTPFGVGMVLFYLVGYVFSNIGAFMVVEVVGHAEGTTAIRGFRGLAQRWWGSGRSSTSSGRRPKPGSTASCFWGRY